MVVTGSGSKKGKPIHRVVIYAKAGSEECTGLASSLGSWLEERGVRVRYDRETARALRRKNGLKSDTPPKSTDLLLVAGGDGTLLRAARTSEPAGIPILGVNLGSLGFLTELQPDELYPDMEKVLRGDYSIEERCTLNFRLFRGRRKRSEHVVLNDVVIAKSALARMITLGVDVDGENIATYTSDGLIVCTPTGSTAYSLSAGGPILDPSMSAIVVTPICPHSMTYRPLVVQGTSEIRVRLSDSSHEEVFLTLDGQVGFPLEHRDEIRIRSGKRKVRLARVAGRSFFEVLRRKLRWGVR
jgi:NAD+ kinase